jgi:DNA-binding transcriptional MerR regulator
MLFTMKDAENLSGIKDHTIRAWEKRYSILNPHRSLTNIRYYDSLEIKTILNIALLNKYGHKISAIAKMPGHRINTEINSISEKSDIIINELIHKIIDADIAGFDSLLQTHTNSEGLQTTVLKILSPIVEKSETIWQLKNINPALKHWVCFIIKQKIFAALEKIKNTDNKNAKCACLFLPTGANNDIGLLLMSYLLKSIGFNIIYLGHDVAIPEVEFICKTKKPDFLYIHLSATGIKFKFNKLITDVEKYFNNKHVIISGKVPQSYHRKSLSKIIFKRSVKDSFQFIESSKL